MKFEVLDSPSQSLEHLWWERSQSNSRVRDVLSMRETQGRQTCIYMGQLTLPDLKVRWGQAV